MRVKGCDENHSHVHTHSPPSLTPDSTKGRINVHHIQNVINELVRALQEVAQVEAGVVVEDVLQLGVCEDTEDLVVGVHHLQSKLGGRVGGGGGGGGGGGRDLHSTLHMHMNSQVHRALFRKEGEGKERDMYMYMCKNTMYIMAHTCTCMYLYSTYMYVYMSTHMLSQQGCAVHMYIKKVE